MMSQTRINLKQKNLLYLSFAAHHSFIIVLPCIVISVKYPQFGQMIDFGFSENEMMDECLPLTLRVGDYKRTSI